MSSFEEIYDDEPTGPFRFTATGPDGPIERQFDSLVDGLAAMKALVLAQAGSDISVTLYDAIRFPVAVVAARAKEGHLMISCFFRRAEQMNALRARVAAKR